MESNDSFDHEMIDVIDLDYYDDLLALFDDYYDDDLLALFDDVFVDENMDQQPFVEWTPPTPPATPQSDAAVPPPNVVPAVMDGGWSPVTPTSTPPPPDNPVFVAPTVQVYDYQHVPVPAYWNAYDDRQVYAAAYAQQQYPWSGYAAAMDYYGPYYDQQMYAHEYAQQVYPDHHIDTAPPQASPVMMDVNLSPSTLPVDAAEVMRTLANVPLSAWGEAEFHDQWGATDSYTTPTAAKRSGGPMEDEPPRKHPRH
ncbi:PREDICTED: uncharacterized protein LOC109476190 [Branchiostoma belcheri]|uniref:Uncharacterized protein LOC109476190 n=1 Tax=Branchiostoma belcheri TaxID=7741 RepID=A0A6P4YT87_BRABE|nr:PREDICTED: uncharacterized protein LOC109476190 [Branchiostoma belcheri]